MFVINFEERVLELLAKQGEQITAMQATLAEHGAMLKVLDERSLKSAVLLETEVARDTHLLYEGHSELKRELDTRATKEQVEELSGEVAIIKDVVTRHSVDIGKLKKAQ